MIATATRRRDARVGAAVAAARGAGIASRLLRQGGGTALPGLVAERVAPGLLGHLAAQLPRGAAMITGTNGKTTTCHMLAAILEAAGMPAVRNATGSNLARGLATTLAARADWQGRLNVPHGAVGVFETDEAAFAQAAPAVRPRLVVVTNLFRDQLDRYGEVDAVAALWRGALELTRAGPLPRPLTLALNADDPTVAALGGPLPDRDGAGDAGGGGAVYFGVEDVRWGQRGPEHAADAKVCPVCGALLDYPVCFYGHIGHYACANGHRRPAPAVAARDLEFRGFAGTTLTLATPEGQVSFRLPVPGLYNVHNALAAATAAHLLGAPLAAIRRGLAGFSAAFGRLERVEVDGRTIYLLLAKNPVGMNEALRTLFLDGRPKHLLLALNDLDADGRDVSWIWDADFERVAGHVCSLVVGGRRAADLALRLKYAGVVEAWHPTPNPSPVGRGEGDLSARPAGKPAGWQREAGGGAPLSVGLPVEEEGRSSLQVQPALSAALDAALAQTPPGETLYAVLTYTAMLELRHVLVNRGYLRAYWADK
jgi:UDP-N-acetylmuramyl tripeptide synthase